MRIRSLFCCVPALALLAACSKDPVPARLDFVGATGLTSGNRTVGVGDTVLTRAYAESNQPLQRLRVEVEYTPGLEPITYPIPTSSFDAANAPKPRQLVYLDSVLPAGSSAVSKFLLSNGLVARTTSGQETWTYTATDAGQQTAARRYRLTVHKADSAAAFHSYPLVLRPLPGDKYSPADVVGARNSRRVYLNLRYGLLLPRYAVLNNENSLQDNQSLVDLVALANATGTTLSLAAPADNATNLPAAWAGSRRRKTEIRLSTLTPAQFASVGTTAAFAAAFTAGTPYQTASGATNANVSGPLVVNRVLAFKAFDDNDTPYYGLLQVVALTPGSSPVLTCQVRVQK